MHATSTKIIIFVFQKYRRFNVVQRTTIEVETNPNLPAVTICANSLLNLRSYNPNTTKIWNDFVTPFTESTGPTNLVIVTGLCLQMRVLATSGKQRLHNTEKLLKITVSYYNVMDLTQHLCNADLTKNRSLFKTNSKLIQIYRQNMGACWCKCDVVFAFLWCHNGLVSDFNLLAKHASFVALYMGHLIYAVQLNIYRLTSLLRDQIFALVNQFGYFYTITGILMHKKSINVSFWKV